MRGEVDFSESLRQRVKLLAGIPEARLDLVRRKLTLTEGASELVAAIHSRGGVAAAVSGGFNQLLEPIRTSLQLDYVSANNLEINLGKLTGRVIEPIVDRSAKANFLEKLREQLGLQPQQTIAVGDGANDIEMIQTAGLGIAFCAKPGLRQHADILVETRNLAQIIELLP